MSEQARRERSARQVWALPGSSHDRLIAGLKIALPCAIGVLGAFLVTAPLAAGGDVSFVLDKHKVDVAHERLRIQQAEYRGQDGKGQPFTLDAQSAVQKSSAEPVVRLAGLVAGMSLPDGPARLVANYGRYDMRNDQVAIDGPIAVDGPRGYTLRTRDATVDLKARTIASGSAVTGTVTQGVFSADSLHADLATRDVMLDGHAHLRIVPAKAR